MCGGVGKGVVLDVQWPGKEAGLTGLLRQLVENSQQYMSGNTAIYTHNTAIGVVRMC